MMDRILDSRHGAVMEEGRLQCCVTQWRASELVAVGGIAGDLFQSIVLVLPGPVEQDVPFPYSKRRRDLRHAYDVHLEIAEHLVRLTAHGVAFDALPFAEEDECAALLLLIHRARVTARKSIDRRIGKDQREFEL